jgi:hypothetical protein
MDGCKRKRFWEREIYKYESLSGAREDFCIWKYETLGSTAT